jgi:hypothetical protein
MGEVTDAIASVIGTVVICGMIVSLFIVPRYFKYRERERMQDTIRAAIEKGQQLPPEVLDAMTRDVRPASSRARDVRVGVIWLAIAAALVGFGLFLGTFNDIPEHAFFGIAALPGAIGVAFIVLSFFNKQR